MAALNRRKSIEKPPTSSSSSRKLSSKNNDAADASAPVAETLTVLCRFRSFRPVPATGAIGKPSPYGFVESSGLQVNLDAYDSRMYTFDRVFDTNTIQSDIFVHVESVVESVMRGFNGTILAYGQTSSGKTHTMEGPNIRANISQLTSSQVTDIEGAEQLGIIPRTIDKLFKCILDPKYSTTEFVLIASYFEIYCEKVRDLLNPSADNMKLREYTMEAPTANRPAPCAGFIVQDMTEVYCTCCNDVYGVIDTGKGNRAIAPTLMNAESSRSHSILLIKVNQKQLGEDNLGLGGNAGAKKNSRLYLVDLAGSEKVGKTGATGERLKEAQNINRSLTTFGMVINALSEGLSHVPYRDSKLTMVLMDSIGGNSKTTLIICCSPEYAQLNETLSTLRFGERAKCIQNVVKVNEELGLSEYKVLVANYKAEILQLKQSLASRRLEQGITDSPSPMLPLTPADLVSPTAVEEAEVELLKYKLLELSTELEQERTLTTTHQMTINSMKTDDHMNQCLIKELEDKLFKATTHIVAPVLKPCIEDILNEHDDSDDDKEVEQGGAKSPEVSDIVAQQATLQSSITQELNALKMADPAGMEHTDEATKAKLSEYTAKYERLSKESNEQIDRIMMKLTHEQQIRFHMEQQYHEAMEKLQLYEEQSNPHANTNPYSSPSSFGKYFNSNSPSATTKDIQKSKSTGSSWSKFALGTAVSMFKDITSSSNDSGGLFGKNSSSYSSSGGGSNTHLQQLYNTQSKQLQAMSKKLEVQAQDLASKEYDLECLREQQDTLMELKDNILKAILQQNTVLTEERDAYALRMTEMTETTEQLTSLLQTSLKKTSTLYSLHTTPTVYNNQLLQSHKSIRGGAVIQSPENLSSRFVQETMAEEDSDHDSSGEVEEYQEESVEEESEMDADMVL